MAVLGGRSLVGRRSVAMIGVRCDEPGRARSLIGGSAELGEADLQRLIEWVEHQPLGSGMDEYADHV